MRAGVAVKFQQLETAVQEKLDQAQTRRAQIEKEQKEKLRSHVSFVCRQLDHHTFLSFCWYWIERLYSASKLVNVVYFFMFTQNTKPVEIRQTVESVQEVRKTEVTAQIETKLTTAEQKREKEIQRKLEIAKKLVNIFFY